MNAEPAGEPSSEPSSEPEPEPAGSASEPEPEGEAAAEPGSGSSSSHHDGEYDPSKLENHEVRKQGYVIDLENVWYGYVHRYVIFDKYFSGLPKMTSMQWTALI